jgi:hypothetical protein
LTYNKRRYAIMPKPKKLKKIPSDIASYVSEYEYPLE